jgi:hypothetical protein
MRSRGRGERLAAAVAEAGVGVVRAPAGGARAREGAAAAGAERGVRRVRAAAAGAAHAGAKRVPSARNSSTA